MAESWAELPGWQIGLIAVVLSFLVYLFVSGLRADNDASTVTDRWIASVVSAFGRVARLLKPKRGGNG